MKNNFEINQVETTQIYTHISYTELHNRVDEADKMPFVSNYSKAYKKVEQVKESTPEIEMMRLEIEKLKEKNRQLELIREMRPIEVKSTVPY